MLQRQKGFFLIETLFTMAIICLGAMTLGQALMFAYFHSKQSSQRLQFQQLLGHFQANIQASPYNSSLLEVGNHWQNEGEAAIHWQVEEPIRDLKEIHLTLNWKQLALKVSFYKSKYFPEEGNYD